MKNKQTQLEAIMKLDWTGTARASGGSYPGSDLDPVEVKTFFTFVKKTLKKLKINVKRFEQKILKDKIAQVILSPEASDNFLYDVSLTKSSVKFPVTRDGRSESDHYAYSIQFTHGGKNKGQFHGKGPMSKFWLPAKAKNPRFETQNLRELNKTLKQFEQDLAKELDNFLK